MKALLTHRYYILILIGFTCILAVCTVLRTYLSAQWFHLLLGGLTLPFLLESDKTINKSLRFGYVSLGFIVLSFFIPVHTLLYFAWIALLFFLYEWYCGKITILVIAVAILASPIFNYLGNTFTFPIRLWLTGVCGSLFKLAGLSVQTAGNTLVYAGNDFTVDPACMGLSMLSVSLLISILMLGYFQKKHRQQLPFWVLCLYWGMVFVLTVFSNLVRMIILVLFHILPETFLHDFIGIFCLCIQVLLPIWGIGWWLTSRNYFPVKEFTEKERIPKERNPNMYIPLSVCLCICFWVSAIHISGKQQLKPDEKPVSLITLSDHYQVTPFAPGIIKVESKTALIYIKRIRWCIDTEHNPMICWTGSGYQMLQTHEKQMGNQVVYTGIIQNGKDTLYTAWWYSNGETNTHSQLQWRWDMLKGAPAYSLVNVTATSEEVLEEEIRKVREEIQI